MITFLTRHPGKLAFALFVLLLANPFPALAQEAAEGFVPLTQLPGIQAVAESESLSAFLDILYRLCVGAAAVLAVIQIIHGGIKYMLQDSFTEKKEGKDLILYALLGLLLVLSPTIVFNLIDPNILNLDINAEPLQLGDFAATPGDPVDDDGDVVIDDDTTRIVLASYVTQIESLMPTCGLPSLTAAQRSCVSGFIPTLEESYATCREGGSTQEACLAGLSARSMQVGAHCVPSASNDALRGCFGFPFTGF